MTSYSGGKCVDNDDSIYAANAYLADNLCHQRILLSLIYIRILVGSAYLFSSCSVGGNLNHSVCVDNG